LEERFHTPISPYVFFACYSSNQAQGNILPSYLQLDSRQLFTSYGEQSKPQIPWVNSYPLTRNEAMAI